MYEICIYVIYEILYMINRDIMSTNIKHISVTSTSVLAKNNYLMLLSFKPFVGFEFRPNPRLWTVSQILHGNERYYLKCGRS